MPDPAVKGSWIALFRGINVGGKNVLRMKDLVVTLEELGCTDVRTYIQSGNVVFRSRRTDALRLANVVGEAVRKQHGFKPYVLVMKSEELEQIAAANPFPAAETQPKTLHVFLLSEEPVSPDINALNKARVGTEEFVLKGRAFYLHAPDGLARSRLAMKAESILGVSATARNWRTVSSLLSLAQR